MLRRRRLLVWLWILPAAVLLGVFLVYPALETLRVSFASADSSEFVGFANYTKIFSQEDTRVSLLNNLLWVVVFTGGTVVLGLLIAIVSDRVRYEVAIKTVVFIPMAISFAAAGVIWRFMYAFQPPGATQWGTLNAVVTGLGGEPRAWLVDRSIVPLYGVNNLAIIIAGVWMWTGFAMVILSAALKSIPREILEAARVDGAGEWQILRRITIPLLGPTIAVVATTLVINALKVFDLVFVMTSGNFDTNVIANRMWNEMFVIRNFGRAGALAVILLVAIVPVMLVNVRRFRREEASR